MSGHNRWTKIEHDESQQHVHGSSEVPDALLESLGES